MPGRRKYERSQKNQKPLQYIVAPSLLPGYLAWGGEVDLVRYVLQSPSYDSFPGWTYVRRLLILSTKVQRQDGTLFEDISQAFLSFDNRVSCSAILK